MIKTSNNRITEYKLNKVISYEDALTLRKAWKKGIYPEVYQSMLRKYKKDIYDCTMQTWEFSLMANNTDRTFII